MWIITQLRMLHLHFRLPKILNFELHKTRISFLGMFIRLGFSMQENTLGKYHPF
jgi:hypothetical protein